MARVDSASLRRLHQADTGPSLLSPVLNPTSTTNQPLSARAFSGVPYDSASVGRRLGGWQPTRLGPTTNLWGTHDLSLARCRDVVRNNPWGISAVDNWESQVVGNGIRPRWNIKNVQLKLKVETEWRKWATSKLADLDGIVDHYGQQALAAREIFAAGEIFARAHTAAASKQMRVPLRIQLIESEQIPIFLNNNSQVTGVPAGNVIRVGIEFNDHERVAYHMYKEHPGETMFYPMGGLQFVRVPANRVYHAYKPLQAGQLRGVSYLSGVLLTLYELDKYTDAAVVKKQIQTMFAGFISKQEPTSDVLPGFSPGTNPTSPTPYSYDPSVMASKIETGTMQVLLPGETITFPQLPQDSDIETFLRVMLHRFSIGVGATYEQITGDLKGVNYSSIRAGLLDFRRKCEQFQQNILIRSFCHPIALEWLREAVLEGTLKLPGYAQNPEMYEDINWSRPAWPWVDPLKDVQASQASVRNGFTARESVCAEGGEDAATVDAQTAADVKRANGLGLVYDTDPSRILVGRESNPTVPAPDQPKDKKTQDSEDAAEKEQDEIDESD